MRLAPLRPDVAALRGAEPGSAPRGFSLPATERGAPDGALSLLRALLGEFGAMGLRGISPRRACLPRAALFDRAEAIYARVNGYPDGRLGEFGLSLSCRAGPRSEQQRRPRGSAPLSSVTP